MNCVNLLIFHRSSYRFEKMWTAVRCWARALCGASARRGRRRCSDWAILGRETPEKPGAEAQPVDGGWGQTKQPFPYAGSASPASPLRCEGGCLLFTVPSSDRSVNYRLRSPSHRRRHDVISLSLFLSFRDRNGSFYREIRRIWLNAPDELNWSASIVGYW